MFGHHENSPAQTPDNKSKLAIVDAVAASLRCGFVVDEIVGRRDIVIKALTGPLISAPGFAGVTELSDQHVALVLDMPMLLEEVLMPGTIPKLAARVH
ncbi:MAG: chemotaxis protein CheW [Polyangiaceae bacterium]|nr:chemotaxis protein CheW [Polyangiaceae bacterium]